MKFPSRCFLWVITMSSYHSTHTINCSHRCSITLKKSSSSRSAQIHFFFFFLDYLKAVSVLRLHCIGYYDDRWITELERILRKQSWSEQGTSQAFAWRDWGKPTKSFSQDNLCPGQDLNPVPPNCKPVVLPIDQTVSQYIIKSLQ
jgi:hypothetical protein